MTPFVQLMPDGQRLHLQHGPSDLIIWAEGARDAAYRAATRRFQTIIAEIVDELAALREMLSPFSKRPGGPVARRMHDVCAPFASSCHVTRMAAVAGSVADEVLAAMTSNADIMRAYVNNGGDIALHLAPGTSFATAIKGHDGADLGRVRITANDGIGGIATSGRHGRSLSLGIADSVTALAPSAAGADVAATLIANAVDLPGHPAITRQPACDVDDDSDLVDLPVVTGCRQLSANDCARALSVGRRRALFFQSKGFITSAALFLQDHAATTGTHVLPSSEECQYVEN
ncbi:MAG: UPF0280 family protein [Roseovarius sp.]|nr:UPF0280 family protein [Roseovarius sp.]MCY4206428.1 UPF0280 family protein [Roseovarius sp.]MCY4291070.1 UPF0280 family protein [Roseovarius sp.]MCY4316279.1 UPF0280 family protein [Roseovarius sp.]